MLSRIVKLILLTLIPFYINAQDINFKHISFKEGLAQSPISTFLQDEKGFIWFGNFKGLTRYDGYEFKTFKADYKNQSTLSHNRVNVIFQDSEKRIWIGTANGLNLYDQKYETFKHVDILDIKGGRNYVSSIVEDKQKNIWVGTFGGLKKLNVKQLSFEDIPNSLNDGALQKSVIFSLYSDKENKIWIGTETGLKQFDPVTQTVLPLPQVFLSGQNFASNRILVTKQDLEGNLWFGTEISGVFKYSKTENSLTNYGYSVNKNSLADNWVKDILVEDKQNIWFATRKGISILNTTTQKFSNYKHDPLNANSLIDNTVWSFLKDKASCVWVGTLSGDIDFYYKGNSNFENIADYLGEPIGINHTLINAIIQDKDGSLWVGTYGGGLHHINRKTNENQSFHIKSKTTEKPENGIKSLADDGKGNLWVGTSDGLAIFNKETQTYKYYNYFKNNYAKNENPILCVLPDGEGSWIGFDGGGLRYVLQNGNTAIFKFRPSNLPTKTGLNFYYEPNIYVSWALPKEFFAFRTALPENEIADNFVTALLKDGDNYLWIGTQNGLDYYDKKADKILKLYQKVGDTPYQLTNSNVTTLFKDSKNRLWVGTEEGGLNYLDKTTNRFYNVGTKEGLKDNVIHAIVEDLKGNLWVSTDLGIYQIVFKKFELPFNKENLSITQYTSNDGLSSNQFSTQAGLLLNTGEIAFGGIKGLSIFFPQNILKNTKTPKVVITNLLVNNKELKIGGSNPLSSSILETKNITLPYYQSNLSIKYAALNYINPENNKYVYKLKGLKSADDWQNVGNQRVVNFANLTPGSYIFMVKASNNDGVWSKKIKSLKITILPPWWLTWWAYLIYFLVFCGICYIIIKFLRNRETLKRNLYIEHLQNERQNELYKMKLNFFTNISHELRTPLTLILGPIEKLIHENENPASLKSLNLVKSNANRLMNLVTELLDFRKVEEGHMKLYWSYKDIIVFCDDVYKSFEALAAFKNINYQFEAPSKPIYVYFDSGQLEKVVFNLLSNAFKFTNDGGRITLKVGLNEANTDMVQITVIDNGKGIAKDFEEKLFDSFFQIDDRGTENIGSGIGLALAKSIMELHKGEIKVFSSEDPKKETSFIILLRLGKSHLKESDIFEEELIRKIDDVDQNIESIKQEDIDNTNAEVTQKTFKIMIVEDNDEVRGLLADSLKENYHIVECENGQIALNCLEKELPDLIVSDVMMPEVDGLELCLKVKSKEDSNHIPFILLTAKGSEKNQISGLNIGADIYISKPFSLQVLKLNIRNLLKAQEVLREKFSQRIVLEPTNLPVTTSEEKFINKLMKIIDEKIEDSYFDVNELVKEIGMSRAVLYKKVHTLTGFSVADLIKQMRLKRAAHLFKTTSYNVTEITYMAGFNHRKHFSKEFKKQYNMSPSEFIKANKEEV
ncbi:response regulator [Pedobacter sp. SD-b]|uniref:histidine kinase n=1 Tax=Pedobacter segetis TaxID=2793069 RepID=A0ABS1BM00_9SPHI|nr:hybrid sensor histidine kinase/response regulator transcription factor [Pedobacter segetis]MBK0383925.1 response regulator [Pedobacter segetis]